MVKLQTHVQWQQQYRLPKQSVFYVREGCGCWTGYGKASIQGVAYPDWMSEAMCFVMPYFDMHEQDHWPTACYMQHFNGGSQSHDWCDFSEGILGGSYAAGRTLTCP